MNANSNNEGPNNEGPGNGGPSADERFEERFDELLQRYLDGDRSEPLVADLHAAVSASDAARQRFQQAARLDILLREGLTEQVELRSLAGTRAPDALGRSYWRPRTLALAATLLIGTLTLGYSIYRGGPRDAPQMGVCMSVSGGSELGVQRGEQHYRADSGFPLRVGDRVTCDAQTKAMLRLSDGSIVSMEPGSLVSLDSDSPRLGLLRGEAFFEIAPRRDGMPPFEVLTGQSTVAVMGTVFSLVATDHSDAAAGQTEVKVYEGSVKLTRSSDQAEVSVGSQQMATTDDLAVQDLSSPALEVRKLLPIHDVTIDHGAPAPQTFALKVEGGRRVAYIMFDIPDVSDVRSAKLRLTQIVDSGSGTLRFFVGDHSDWRETSLFGDAAPEKVREVAQHRGVVGGGQVVSVDVTDAVRGPGPLTLIMTLDKSGEDDIWFGSRDSKSPPELILTIAP
ncbi:FecR protein [Pirellulimonas nuda]|uniref:FecR protein n=1 Tax=Pirellulimonas nuda TaxID=2528009 RepID=A0A518DFP5_9BACT|nr:FecR family protein [Pirellulimonas nuda]QDU90286.1 FecR protein [Pirellulimonas nuda]